MNETSFNFSELIDEYLRRERHPRRNDVLYPSELGSCLRQVYYTHLIPVGFPPEKLRMFKSADLAHAFVRDVLASSNRVKLLDWEKPFSFIVDDFEISGRLDDLIVVQLEGKEEPVVVEVKSIRGKTVEYIAKPSFPHLMQMQPYLKAARASFGVLWYLARDTYADRWFSVFFDQKLWNAVIDRSRQIHKCLVERTLPPPEARTNKDLGYLCRFCPYWWDCKNNENPPPGGEREQALISEKTET